MTEENTTGKMCVTGDDVVVTLPDDVEVEGEQNILTKKIKIGDRLKSMRTQYEALLLEKGRNLRERQRLSLEDPASPPGERLTAAMGLYKVTPRMLEKHTGLRRKHIRDIASGIYYPRNEDVVAINTYFANAFNHAFVLI